MRLAVFLLALAYAALYVVSWGNALNGGGDAAGRGMALGFISIGATITAGFVIPALILAVLNKAPKWALGLALAPGVFLILVFALGIL